MTTKDVVDISLQLATLGLSIGTAIWAVGKWIGEKRAARLREDRLNAGLYVDPFIGAAVRLQSRIWNILCKNGLDVAINKEQRDEIAIETVSLIVRYLGWSNAFFRYATYARDRNLLEIREKIERTLATDGRFLVDDPFCIHRTMQTELAESAIAIQSGPLGQELIDVPFVQIKKLVTESPRLKRAIEDLAHASGNDFRGALRLSALHAEVLKMIAAVRALDSLVVTPELGPITEEARKQIQARA